MKNATYQFLVYRKSGQDAVEYLTLSVPNYTNIIAECNHAVAQMFFYYNERGVSVRLLSYEKIK